MPIPVRPAMQTGNQPPLGVTETTQPFSSAAWIEVVQRGSRRHNRRPPASWRFSGGFVGVYVRPLLQTRRQMDSFAFE